MTTTSSEAANRVATIAFRTTAFRLTAESCRRAGLENVARKLDAAASLESVSCLLRAVNAADIVVRMEWGMKGQELDTHLARAVEAVAVLNACVVLTLTRANVAGFGERAAMQWFGTL